MLDAFLGAGGKLVDTADIYGDGGSERTLAPWLARRRDEVVLATKVRFAVSDPAARGSTPTGSARPAMQACAARRRRHRPLPAPRAGSGVPLEDSLEALDGLVRAGKVRALGASNFPAWLLAWAVALQDREGWSPFVSLQPQYSLVERSIEIESCRSAAPPASVCPVGPARRGLPYRPLSRDAPPARGLADGAARRRPRGGARRRGVERNFRAVDEAAAVADERGATVPQVAIAWLLHRPDHGADPRPAHPRAARGPPPRRRPAAVRGAARAPRSPHRAPGRLSSADAARAG